MSQPAHLRVILADHNARKLALPSGIPGTVNDLCSIIRGTFEIAGAFTLHYKNVDSSDIKDKETVVCDSCVYPGTPYSNFN